MIDNLCSPALLYVGFSLVHIVIDMSKQLYNTAFLKFLVMTIFTIILNLLCEQGLGIISWFMVFIPFIFMTVITTLLLFIFGLDPKNGKFNYSVNKPNEQNNILKTIRPEQSHNQVNTKTLPQLQPENIEEKSFINNTISSCVNSCSMITGEEYKNLCKKKCDEIFNDIKTGVINYLKTPETKFVNRETNREQNNSSIQKWNLEIIQN
uniref:Transmembrane protein n=1 Tax=viral metagenome TaxID=1070528 RepID=A0A6C0AY80_9ZZZZ|tara:strand:- start:75243 stop:75866 length:624 start_codon:yes stop_codon:yes gene_type:complete